MATAASSDAISTNPVDHCSIVSKKLNTTEYMCNYCELRFSGSSTRCYIHLTGDGKGVRQCSSCPADVRSALTAAKAQKQLPRHRNRARTFRLTSRWMGLMCNCQWRVGLAESRVEWGES
jgi:hypothetical protein